MLNLQVMKILKIIWAFALVAWLASCSSPQRGFDYNAHAKSNKKYGKRAAHRADSARNDLTQFDCGR
jgi:hypothetical protein